MTQPKPNTMDDVEAFLAELEPDNTSYTPDYIKGREAGVRATWERAKSWSEARVTAKLKEEGRIE